LWPEIIKNCTDYATTGILGIHKKSPFFSVGLTTGKAFAVSVEKANLF